MVNKLDLSREWLPRYTGMPIDRFVYYVLLTNFENYFIRFVTRFDCEVYGAGRPMQARGWSNSSENQNSADLCMTSSGICIASNGAT